MVPDPDFWRGKRVLLTGHTGFKGSWLALWLERMGAVVTGIALTPQTQPSLYTAARLSPSGGSHLHDIRDAAAIASITRECRPEILLHLAAQPLVRASYRLPIETFATNVMGTAHLLEACRQVDTLRVAVLITTDKVYRNREWSWPYREDDALGGHDPYSASKAAAEIVISCYREAYLAERGLAVASARAGNVIGGGDWSEDRLLPDAVRAWQSGQPLDIRRPLATRPWQHVLEPLAGYLVLAERLWQSRTAADAYNFGPLSSEAASVREVVSLAREAFGRGEVRWGNGTEGPHEAGRLALETSRTQDRLGVRPCWSLAEGVTRTMHWYRDHERGADARALCDADIGAWVAAAKGSVP